ncbi:MAG TPA: MATE family efflux transporter [Chitinophagaceae bacterium]|nr:MATE family efflux transporter [Chitinophagaceae bacterium]
MKLKQYFKIVSDAIQGIEHDYTKGNIQKAIVLLAIPMILELSLESVFALVDMFFVGKLGKNAIATVGLTESVVTIIYSVAIGLSTAATAIIARRIGEKNKEAASHAAMQSLLVAMICTLILSTIGVVFAAQILQLMGASPEVIRDGTLFTQIMLGGSVVIILLFLLSGIFRGAGNAAIAMKSLWIASGINIILCPFFIYTLDMGLKGAAIATTIGRGVGVIYQLYHLMNNSGQLFIKKKHLKIHFATIKSILAIAWPATFQFVIASASWIVMSKLVAETGGTNASAGYQIAIRNVVFFILPAWGLSNAAATLVGQNLGAQEINRAKLSVMLTAKYNAYFMAFVTLLFVIFPVPIISFFTKEKEVIAYGVSALRIIGTGYIFYGIGMVMMQALNGAGDTRTPTIINFVCFWLIQIPLAYLLSTYFQYGPIGVFVSIPIAETLIAIIAYFVFKKGKWTQKQV